MKKKIIMALALALLWITATAAADVPATQKFIEEQVVPMAQANDSAGAVNEDFSSEELAKIVRLAEENGVDVPERLQEFVRQNRGYYEEETIMSLYREALGSMFSEWPIENKHWFGEIVVKIGFREDNPDQLPKGDEIPYEQALDIAAAHIQSECGDDIRDTARWKEMTCYRREAGDGEDVSPKWFFDFEPLSVDDPMYQVTVDAKGSVVAFDVDAAPDENSTAEEFIVQYGFVHGSFNDWTYQTWATLGVEIEGRDPGTERGWAFQNAGYRLPPEEGITEDEAKEIALKSIDREYTTVSGTMCCTVGETPIWKIQARTMRPEDEGSGEYTAIWLLEIDCMSGDVRESREYVAGTTEPRLQWIPFEVFENMPPMPAGPNG